MVGCVALRAVVCADFVPTRLQAKRAVLSIKRLEDPPSRSNLFVHSWNLARYWKGPRRTMNALDTAAAAAEASG